MVFEQCVPEESGHALLEFSFSMIFLGALVAGIIDVGAILNDYMKMTEAVHQGARFATGVSALKNLGTAAKLTPKQLGCESELTPATFGVAEIDSHRTIQQRTIEMINLEKTAFKADSLCIFSTLGDNPPVKDVIIRASAIYPSMLFGEFSMSVEAKAPFLQD